MKEHGFFGDFDYRPEYSCDDKDLRAAKDIYGDISHVNPVVDMQLGDERAILLSVDDSQCVAFIDESGDRFYYDSGDRELPESQEELARSFSNWTTGGPLVNKRSNLWDFVHRISNKREGKADFVMRDKQK